MRTKMRVRVEKFMVSGILLLLFAGWAAGQAASGNVDKKSPPMKGNFHPDLSAMQKKPASPAAPLMGTLDKAAAGADKNKDGRVTRVEFLDAMGSAFDLMDKNHDDVLDPSERAAPPRALSASEEKFLRLFQTRDLNKDGKLSPDEFQEVPPQMFNMVDKDGDGYLTLDELNAMSRKRAPATQSAPGSGMMPKMDADGDGIITREEFKGPDNVFQRMDLDSDGQISAEEMEEWRNKARE